MAPNLRNASGAEDKILLGAVVFAGPILPQRLSKGACHAGTSDHAEQRALP
jgi:hypothetical protein